MLPTGLGNEVAADATSTAATSIVAEVRTAVPADCQALLVLFLADGGETGRCVPGHGSHEVGGLLDHARLGRGRSLSVPQCSVPLVVVVEMAEAAAVRFAGAGTRYQLLRDNEANRTGVAVKDEWIAGV